MKRLIGLTLALAGLAAACVDDTPEADFDNTLEVFGPYQGIEADRFGAVLAVYEAITGVAVRYIGSADFVADLLARADEPRNTPDLAIVPQIGTVEQLVARGQIIPMAPEVQAAVDENYSTRGGSFGEVDGTLYAVPYRVTIKSLVWYRPALFEEKGWTVPSTLADLETLVELIESEDDERAPWCFGLEAGGATGWAATDWTEDLVLRLAGLDIYSRWANGRVEFSAPGVERAFDAFSDLVLESDRALGGIDGVLDTPVEEAVLPLFAVTGGCALYKQADFAASWMPPGTVIGPDGDVDFFVLPGVTAEEPAPILVGGDEVVQFRDSPQATSLAEFLASPAAGILWASHGGFLSPNAAVPESAYPEDYLRELNAVLLSAPTVAYDASDRMPPAFGSDVLWSDITSWVGGSMDYQTFADESDRALARAEDDANSGNQTTEPSD